MNILIFDASTLITLAMNGLLRDLRELKKMFNGKFIITQEVKREVIDRPIKIKRFELEALRVKQLLDEKVLEMPSSLKISDNLIIQKTDEMLKIANNLFQSKGKQIKLISAGETSCLALSRLLEKRKIDSVIAIDERTTRMLSEMPENLESLLRKKLHTNVVFNQGNFDIFRGFKFIRSSELVYIIYKKGISKLKNGLVLDALLYAVKFKGCAISEEEIEAIKRIG